MVIIHKIEDFLVELFPNYGMTKDVNTLKEELEKYYTYGVFRPKISIQDGWAKVEIDTPKIASLEADYRKAISLCEKGNFQQAKPLLEDLLKKDPTNSEFHRVYGQVISDEGDIDSAIDCLIDALRWNPKNGYALLLMGNLFAKHKDDVETALKYYDKALEVNPNDNIAVNNIGANLLQQGKIKEAKKYFWDAIKIDENYPNTHYALAMIAEMENDLPSAFYSAIEAVKKNTQRNGLFANSMDLIMSVAQKLIQQTDGKAIIREYAEQLKAACGKNIAFIADEKIPTAAKLEVAENYDRSEHIVKYKPSYQAGEHLRMHELVHLDFITQARKANINQLFISTQQEKKAFIRNLEPTIKRLNRLGISEEALENYCSSLFEGLNSQIFNAPIDLFIEDFLYEEYPDLRPFQFLSLYGMVKEGLQAVTDTKIVDLSPKEVLSKSKIYNIIGALHFKDLFGIDLISNYKATPLELKQAKDFYQEYLEYRDDREPGEEYELVQHWAEDLNLDKNFELVKELEFRSKRTDLDNILESIEQDPYGVNDLDPHKEKEMNQFQKSQAALGTNMAVVMFMVDAMQYFEGISKQKIREIAFEIAALGTQGIRPDGQYILRTVPKKDFSGYHLLAYYYVSWAIAVPEMLKELKLPYDDEYQMAQTMHRPKK